MPMSDDQRPASPHDPDHVPSGPDTPDVSTLARRKWAVRVMIEYLLSKQKFEDVGHGF